MDISERLKLITGMVTPCGTVADIGCDHCKALIYLLAGKVCERGIGCDIKSGPLAAAKENIAKYGYSNKIELRLGNGLECISPEDKIDCAIISGMGGHLINAVLNKNPKLTGAIRELVLQPQLDTYYVRKNLHQIGFKIVDESMVREQRIYYTIIKAAFGSECYESHTDYLYGKVLIEKKHPILKEYLSFKLDINRRILFELDGQNSVVSLEKINEISEENKIIKGVLECL